MGEKEEVPKEVEKNRDKPDNSGAEVKREMLT